MPTRPEQAPRTIRLTALVLSAALTVAGCAGGPPTAPDGSILSHSDFGEPPTDVDAVIQTYLRNTMKDPYSAQVEDRSGPSRVTLMGSIFGPSAYGWGLCFRVNAKNSFGGYVGFRPHALIWRNGTILRSFGGPGDIETGMARALCERVNGR